MKTNVQGTSLAAWRSHNPGPVNTLILEALEAAGDEGLICDEIEVITGLDHQTVSGNLSHLRHGTQKQPMLVEATGAKGVTRKGRSAAKVRLIEG